MKTKNGTVKASEVVVDRELNVRLDYDVPSMMDSIRRIGKITDPVHVWKKEDGSLVVLRGNRRISAAQELLKEEISKELHAELNKIPAIFYEGLSEKEAFDVVLDQGDQKTLNKAEIAKAVWRCFDQGMDNVTIYFKMYQALALMTGQLKKAHEVEQIRSYADRKTFLQKWFKGTVDQFLAYAWACGPMVKEQVILNLLSGTRPLTEEEKKNVRFDATRKAVTELYKAYKNDKDRGQWNARKHSGPEFEEIVDKFEKIYTGEPVEGESDKPKKMTYKALEGMADQFRSSDLSTLAKVILGQETANLIVLDDEAFRLEMVFETLRELQNDLKGVKKEVVTAILSLDHEQVKNVLTK